MFRPVGARNLRSLRAQLGQRPVETATGLHLQLPMVLVLAQVGLAFSWAIRRDYRAHLIEMLLCLEKLLFLLLNLPLLFLFLIQLEVLNRFRQLPL